MQTNTPTAEAATCSTCSVATFFADDLCCGKPPYAFEKRHLRLSSVLPSPSLKTGKVLRTKRTKYGGRFVEATVGASERARPRSALLFSALFLTLYCVLLLLHFTAEEREAFFFLERVSRSLCLPCMMDGRGRCGIDSSPSSSGLFLPCSRFSQANCNAFRSVPKHRI